LDCDVVVVFSLNSLFWGSVVVVVLKVVKVVA